MNRAFSIPLGLLVIVRDNKKEYYHSSTVSFFLNKNKEIYYEFCQSCCQQRLHVFSSKTVMLNISKSLVKLFIDNTCVSIHMNNQ